jgi:hypothetical protein
VLKMNSHKKSGFVVVERWFRGFVKDKQEMVLLGLWEVKLLLNVDQFRGDCGGKGRVGWWRKLARIDDSIALKNQKNDQNESFQFNLHSSHLYGPPN